MTDSRTRSGLVYGQGYDPWMGLAASVESSALKANSDIINVVKGPFKQMASDNKFDTSTGNIAALIAKFEGRQTFVQYSYSTNSSLEWEKLGQYDLASQTSNSTGEFSEQTNTQARNHTEPKLLQDFGDRFLFEGSVCTASLKWVCIVTDRPCCGTCLSGSINPFALWARNNGVTFYVLDLQSEIQKAQWSPVRTNY